MSVPKYPTYKGSRVPWIGEVPLTWEVKAFKWLLDSNDGGVWGDDPTGEGDTLVLRSTDQTVDGNWRITDPAPRKLSAKEKASALLVEGDLVVTKSSGSSLHIGKTTLVTAEIAQQGYCYGNFMQRLRVNSSFTPKLAWYVMNNELARAQLDLLSNSTTGLANLNGTLIGEILIPVPTVAEQTQIAQFLDHETARLDALAAEQQKLIELLKEKRQALISHAVTKGLDPTVPMKDSGVEWLGEVPEHWQDRKIARDIPFVVGWTPPSGKDEYYDGELPWVTIADMSQMSVEDTKSKISPRAVQDKGAQIVPAGSMLFSFKLSVGKVAFLTVDSYTNEAIAAFLPSGSLDLGYWKYAAPEFIPRYGRENIYGATLLNQELISSVRFLAPALTEQTQIAQFLDQETSKLDALVAEAEQAIELIKERRSAVISAAVTGKIDVRNWQADES